MKNLLNTHDYSVKTHGDSATIGNSSEFPSGSGHDSLGYYGWWWVVLKSVATVLEIVARNWRKCVSSITIRCIAGGLNTPAAMPSRVATGNLQSRKRGCEILEREGHGLQAVDSLDEWRRCDSTVMPGCDGWLRRANARTGKGELCLFAQDSPQG